MNSNKMQADTEEFKTRPPGQQHMCPNPADVPMSKFSREVQTEFHWEQNLQNKTKCLLDVLSSSRIIGMSVKEDVNKKTPAIIECKLDNGTIVTIYAVPFRNNITYIREISSNLEQIHSMIPVLTKMCEGCWKYMDPNTLLFRIKSSQVIPHS